MTDLNRDHNRLVWFDLPVIELNRAVSFYKAVLNIEVFIEKFGDIEFAVLSHDKGNGGCLVVQPEKVGSQGPLIYLNVHGRIVNAVQKVEECGGKVVEPLHAIGPHGFRALIEDSEGNRLALHSEVNS